MKSPIINETGLVPFYQKDKEKKQTPKDDKKEKGGIGTSPAAPSTPRHLETPLSTSIRWIPLQDGSPAFIRSIRPTDAAPLQRMFKRLSKESIYYRFFGYIPDTNPEFFARLTFVDQVREIGIVIETRIKGKREIIGMANIVADADSSKAEYAILIDDNWQGQGLGSTLTDFVCEVAVGRGVRKLYANIMAMNHRILGLLKNKNFSIQRDGYANFLAELEVPQHSIEG